MLNFEQLQRISYLLERERGKLNNELDSVVDSLDIITSLMESWEKDYKKKGEK
jgi:hypothetical protein